MNNRQHNELIGLGVYTLQEASLYGSVSLNKLSRWVFGATNSVPVIVSRLKNQQLISFYDLVQAMAINKAREFGVSLFKIRQAIDVAKSRYNVEFPLAYNHKLVWFDNDLHISFPNDTLIQVSGRGRHQSLMRPIVEPFMVDLHFNSEGLVIRYTPFKKYGRQVILDPTKQFGQPLIGNTGYRADVLDNAFSVERSVELIASIYNIDIKDVKVAVAYMKKIREAA